MANLKQGMSGNEVRDLQKKLIDAGYGDLLGKGQDDGIFGAKTAQAVKAYQKDNGLVVDGIAGKNTLGALNSAGSNKTNTGGNTNTNAGSNKIVDGGTKEPVAGSPKVEEPKVSNILYGNYTPEEVAAMKDQISEASNLLSQAMSGGPGEYQFGADYGIANDYLSKYENRDPFAYDFNSDALYNQYKDQYILQGQMAMMDTMGQAAAMTGGYGNSYAQTVGQQAYNQQLGQLNEIMPELYGMAYDRYNQEGQDLLNMYDLYMGREQENYNLWKDKYAMWQDRVSMAKDNLNTLYGRYTSAYDQKYKEEQDTKSWDYTEKQDAKTDMNNNYNKLANLIQSTGYEPSADELTAAGMSSKEAKALKDAYTAGITVGSTSSSKTGTKYADFDLEEQQKWKKEFADVKTPAEAERLETQMKQAGIDPETAADWKQDKIDELEYNGYEGHMGTKRKDEINTWLKNAFNRTTASGFDPMRLIQGSSFLITAEEKQYALEALKYIQTLK